MRLTALIGAVAGVTMLTGCGSDGSGAVVCLTPCGEPSCTFDQSYRYGPTGGLVVYEDEATLTAPGSYRYERRSFGGAKQSWACSPALPACHDSAAIDVGDVMDAIADREVQAALSEREPPLYGVDVRGVDGTIFRFVAGNGRGFLMGVPCAVADGCPEIPGGIERLVTTLRALDAQQLRDPSCAALR